MYVVCLCKGCDGCCVFICIETRGAVGARVWEVWVFRHADVVCLCLAAVLNAALYMTCRFSMMVEDARSDHMEEACSRAGPMATL